MGYKISRFDKFVASVAPNYGTSRIRAKVQLRSYEAAGKGRRTSGWRKNSADANASADSALAPLRELSRDLKRNNPWAKRGLGVIATNTVGFGIEAKATGQHEEEATALWLKWSRNTNLDYNGRLSFSGIQSLAMKAIAESGEVLIVRSTAIPSDGLPVPVRLRVLEPDFIDTSKFNSGNGGNPIVQGIETDGHGRRVAYWLFTQHPGANALATFGSNLSSIRVPAENVIHVYRMDRPGQMRGVPWLTTAISRLQDLDEYEDAKLMQQKVAALFAVMVTDPDGANTSLSGTDDDDDDNETEDLEPGTMQYLKPGQDVKSLQPPSAADHGEFSAVTKQAIAAGLDVTYEDMTGDYSKVNFSSARMGRMAHYASVDDWRWNMFIPQLCVGVWNWVMEMAAGLNNWSEIPESMWAAPAIPMISPEKEGLAYNRLVRGGFMTLSQAIRERGENPASQIIEIARMNDELDKHGIVLDSDPRRTSAAGLWQDTSGATDAPVAASSDDDE